MEFLDEAIITVRSGDGGRGCISFRREKFIPKGGPDGGDGGKGGNILVRAEKSLYSLSDFRSKKSFRAPDGKPGKAKGQSGRDGDDITIDVPLGTVIEDPHTREILADLVRNGEQILLAAGGKGGRGNQHFATPTNRAPRIAQSGLPGTEKRLRLTLKFLADIGLVGLPNVGKSTLLSRLTMARPRIGAYPFTTTNPNLGVMTSQEENRAVVVADIPGLIEGASAGRGLGYRFLKHIERTNLLVYVLDATYSGEDGLEDLRTLRNELSAYKPELLEKPFIVVVNKMDLYGEGHRDLDSLRLALERQGAAFHAVSALTREGLHELKKTLFEKTRELVSLPEEQKKSQDPEIKRRQDPI